MQKPHANDTALEKNAQNCNRSTALVNFYNLCTLEHGEDYGDPQHEEDGINTEVGHLAHLSAQPGTDKEYARNMRKAQGGNNLYVQIFQPYGTQTSAGD